MSEEILEKRHVGAANGDPCDFYMVWNKRGRPTFRHHRIEVARKEARRLSRRAPGATFILLHGFEKWRVDEDAAPEMPEEHPQAAMLRRAMALIESLRAANAAYESGFLTPEEVEEFDALATDYATYNGPANA